jgi:hypothetical protein
MAGIGVQRNVGDQAKPGGRLADRPQGRADEIVGIGAFRAIGRLQVHRRLGKQGNGGNAEAHRLKCRFHRRIKAQTINPRHGDDGIAPRSRFQEQGPDQVVHRQAVFGNQPPAPLMGADPAHTRAGKGRSTVAGGGRGGRGRCLASQSHGAVSR